MSGQEFVFDENSSCTVGRANDCSPQLPSDEAHRTVSRHHCLLDINPPDIRVRDFGSLNGTYVNGKKIGQREKGMSAEEGAKMSFPEYDLKHGDDIQVGDTVFRIAVFVPARCAECSAEIPEDKKVQAERLPGVFQCESDPEVATLNSSWQLTVGWSSKRKPTVARALIVAAPKNRMTSSPDSTQVGRRDHIAAAGPLKLFLQILEKLQRVVGIGGPKRDPCGATLAFAKAHRVFPALHELPEPLQQVLLTMGNRKAPLLGQCHKVVVRKPPRQGAF